MTGYVEFKIKGVPGAQATISHGETLDRDGNFYNANYRSADAQIKFICDGEEHTYKSALTFFGFRYIRLENWPDEVKKRTSRRSSSIRISAGRVISSARTRR